MTQLPQLPLLLWQWFGLPSRRCGGHGLRVQGVEDGLYHDDINASLHQTQYLLLVRGHQLHKGDVAEAWVLDVGRNGQGAVGGSDRARDELVGARRGDMQKLVCFKRRGTGGSAGSSEKVFRRKMTWQRNR